MKKRIYLLASLVAMVFLFAGIEMSAQTNTSAVKKIEYPGYSYDFKYDNAGQVYYMYDLTRNANLNFMKEIHYPNNLNQIKEATYGYNKGGQPDQPQSKNDVTIYPGQGKINVVEILAPSYPDPFTCTYMVDKTGYYYNGELEGKFSWKGNSLTKVVNEDETFTFKYDTPYPYILQATHPDWLSLMLTHYLGNTPFLDYWYAGSSFRPFDKLPSEITITEDGKKETYKFDYYMRTDANNNPYWYIEVKTVINGNMTKRDKINVYL